MSYEDEEFLQPTQDSRSMTAADPMPTPPVTFTLFGAMGDLARRLLLPAIVNMASQGLLHVDFRIVGVDARDGTDEDLRRLFAVSTGETKLGTSRKEDFWFIVAVRSEDEAEIRAA